MEYSITELYREIGNVFRRNGAERVVLLSSKNNSAPDYELTIEVAVDGFFEISKLQQESGKRWPQIKIILIDLNDNKNRCLADEVMEDGILL